jgi:hypothetical protein
MAVMGAATNKCAAADDLAPAASAVVGGSLCISFACRGWRGGGADLGKDFVPWLCRRGDARSGVHAEPWGLFRSEDALLVRSVWRWLDGGLLVAGLTASSSSLRRPRRETAVSCSTKLWGMSSPVFPISDVPCRWRASGKRHKAASPRGASSVLRFAGVSLLSATAGRRRAVAAGGGAGVCRDLEGPLLDFLFSRVVSAIVLFSRRCSMFRASVGVVAVCSSCFL